MTKTSRLLKALAWAPQPSSTTTTLSSTLPRRSFFTATRITAHSKTSHIPAPARPRPLFFTSRHPLRIRFNSSKPPHAASKPAAPGSTPNPTAQLGSPEPSSLSARLKKLSREYGYSALGVYFALSALDFPFCFLAVRLLGTDRIGHAEHVVIGAFWDVVRLVAPEAGRHQGDKAVEAITGKGASEGEKRAVAVKEGIFTQEVEDAQKANEGSDATLWTQLALAYAIHKSFIFFRVPLTAAVTPKVVKTLRGWGWNIGKKTPKASKPASS
ncbi:hypothetical protein EJ05DRAFT_474820 [Pseudovirgaria hyperparasitica]|uniref:DUF1279 domain-containing protein n=1 Tax=Pseudovirgaria hyperparasitica TaxID=470096 RepID=A0A6A6WC57_9PEZI|nr:uncharacterized protein EJ05DRAFT_474820 [Pseudovirgaria hyperparasitica]KAF2759759.1 hypothetical protein EJ05DRAFT_474820 [Pseudovirgaria hyperparasitica]